MVAGLPRSPEPRCGLRPVAGPVPDKSRMQFPRGINRRKLKNRRIPII